MCNKLQPALQSVGNLDLPILIIYFNSSTAVKTNKTSNANITGANSKFAFSSFFSHSHTERKNYQTETAYLCQGRKHPHADIQKEIWISLICLITSGQCLPNLI